MLTQLEETFLAKILSWSALVTTILVTAWWTLEPVNAPKMVVLCSTSLACVLVLIGSKAKLLKRENRYIALALISFNVFALLSAVMSEDNFTTNFYGAVSRNTGFLTYLALSGILLAATFVSRKENFKKILLFFAIAGLFNLGYCLLTLLWKDIFPWDNPYGNVLGTFGNPNFVGSFLGFVSVGIISYFLLAQSSLKIKLVSLFILLLCIYAIKETQAVQGLVILGIGVILGGYFYLRSLVTGYGLIIPYVIAAVSLACFAVLGALQIGPLESVIYKTSVSLRGLYWDTGILMGTHHPLTGVGIDSYGTYFRVERPESLLNWLGLNVITDAAHNVLIDLFAGGGIPLLLSYISITTIVLISAIKVITRTKNYDPIFVTIFVVWVCYQAQSIISINQIGLAIWGWLLGGLIIAYERATNKSSIEGEILVKTRTKNDKVKDVTGDLVSAKTSMLCILGLVSGFAISFPPVYSDLNWKSALDNKSQQRLTDAAFQWPSNPERIYRTARILLNSKLVNEAYAVLKQGTDQYPESYILWYGRWQMQPESQIEVSEIRRNLQKLDPLNPEFK